jgi:NADH-quinone oxidoreductase subunit C
MTQGDGGAPDADLAARVAAVPGAAHIEARGDALWVAAPDLDVLAMAREMAALGCRLATMTGVARDDGETTIIYHYVRHGLAVNFKTATRGGAIASLAPTVHPASWIEREIHDFFGVTFVGHPNLAPLLRPPGLAAGFFRGSEPGPAASGEP